MLLTPPSETVGEAEPMVVPPGFSLYMLGFGHVTEWNLRQNLPPLRRESGIINARRIQGADISTYITSILRLGCRIVWFAGGKCNCCAFVPSYLRTFMQTSLQLWCPTSGRLRSWVRRFSKARFLRYVTYFVVCAFMPAWARLF